MCFVQKLVLYNVRMCIGTQKQVDNVKMYIAFSFEPKTNKTCIFLLCNHIPQFSIFHWLCRTIRFETQLSHSDFDIEPCITHQHLICRCKNMQLNFAVQKILLVVHNFNIMIVVKVCLLIFEIVENALRGLGWRGNHAFLPVACSNARIRLINIMID